MTTGSRLSVLITVAVLSMTTLVIIDVWAAS